MPWQLTPFLLCAVACEECVAQFGAAVVADAGVIYQASTDRDQQHAYRDHRPHGVAFDALQQRLARGERNTHFLVVKLELKYSKSARCEQRLINGQHLLVLGILLVGLVEDLLIHVDE